MLPEHAAPAERVIKDGWDKTRSRARRQRRALGQQYLGSLCALDRGQTLLTLDLSVGADGARVTSTRGIERGSLVRIYDRENSDYVVVSDVDEKKDAAMGHGYAHCPSRLRRGLAADLRRGHRVRGLRLLRDRRGCFVDADEPLSRYYAPR